MQDKQVGELWRWAVATEGDAEVVVSLIRRLVEECTLNHMNDAEKGFPRKADALAHVLHEFGILKESWK